MPNTNLSSSTQEKEKIEVKVCGLVRTEDIEGTLALGVDYIGLNLWEKSPRCVSPTMLRELLDSIPVGRRVYVDVQPDRYKIDEAIAADFDFFQLHFDPSLSEARIFAERCLEQIDISRLWLAPRVLTGMHWPQWLIPYANAFLCDGSKGGEYGGTGRVADWASFSVLKHTFPEKKWILAGGLGPDNVVAAASLLPHIMDLNSGVEIRPGIKDFKKLARALEAIRQVEVCPD
ncbi:MAG: phosphoribosylanthranilate isomerase [Puniceicoccales bacterium]|jgi:phosphoribosylanthranilate isomerase|nr:phosphoribosylanthranilate isomerase [Puniceicoccales bacterium]